MLTTLALWVGFHVFVFAVLAIDLGIFNRKAHVPSFREALGWTIVWVTLAMLFAAGIWQLLGPQKAIQFVTGYIIEESLSVDNIFVFVLIFTFFAVPREFQHRVLFWGILGAIVSRGTMIALGVALFSRFAWIGYIFGAFLLYTGFKMLVEKEKELHPEKNPFVRMVSKVMPVTRGYEGSRFFVRREGKTLATPLLLVLLVVESTDIVFAVDSIPAIFSVTTDAFIVYTSNIFAILGLRSLYFVLAGAMDKFRYLKPSLSAILIFVGAKMCAARWVHLEPHVSLAIIVGILGLGIGASVIASQREKRRSRRSAA